MAHFSQKKNWLNWWKKESIIVDRYGVGFASINTHSFILWQEVKQILIIDKKHFQVLDRLPEVDFLKERTRKAKIIFLKESMGLEEFKSLSQKKTGQNFIISDLTVELIEELQAYKLKL